MKLTTGFKLTERFALNLVSAALSRYFTGLTTALGTYWEFAKTLEFQSGDTFEFEFLAPTSIVSEFDYLTDGAVGEVRGRFRLTPTGFYATSAEYTVTVDGVVITGSDNYPVDGKLHKVVMTFTSASTIKYLAITQTFVNAYTGILANPIATISGQTQTWTLGNGVGDDTEYNAENTFGAETWDSINFSGAGIQPWTGSFGDTSGNFAITGSGTGARTVSGVLIDGKTYRIRVHADILTGDIDFWYFDGVNNRVLATKEELNAGAQVDVFISDSLAQLYFRSNTAGESTAVLHSISVEEVLGNAITRVNVPDASIEEFQLSEDSTQWDNVSPAPQELQAVIEIALQESAIYNFQDGDDYTFQDGSSYDFN